MKLTLKLCGPITSMLHEFQTFTFTGLQVIAVAIPFQILPQALAENKENHFVRQMHKVVQKGRTMLLMSWYAHGEDLKDVPEEVLKFALKIAVHSRNCKNFSFRFAA